jgi:hypothetical protein
MEQSVMKQRGHPHVSIGSGRWQIVLEGAEAIRAAGWALRFALIARGLAPLIYSGAAVSVATYTLSQLKSYLPHLLN